MDFLLFLGAVLGIHFLALLSPGPDFAMAIKNSISHGRRAGVFTALGFGTAIGIHIAYCAAGLALVISQSILVFNAIKLLGAGYLIFIGISALLTRGKKLEVYAKKSQKKISDFSAFSSGFLTNLLNPKATLFFLGLFSLVIAPNTPNLWLIITAILMMTNTALWFCLVSIFFTTEKVRGFFGKFQTLFEKFFGGILVLFGVKIALSSK